MTIIPIDKELCEQIDIEYYKYSTYIRMLEFAKKNGYEDQYWELWNQFMEVQVSCNTLDEIIRIKYWVCIGVSFKTDLTPIKLIWG